MSSSSSSGNTVNGGMTNMSIHSDILSADIPSDPASKASLVTELKNRARASIQSRNYPAADRLYGKAVEVVDPDDTVAKTGTPSEQRETAILYSNRSLARLQMNKREEAKSDAVKATELDPTYLKGFWRLGQALSALEQYKEAVAAFKEAVVLEPDNKALLKEVERCRTLLDKQKAAAAAVLTEEKKEKEVTNKKPKVTTAKKSTNNNKTTTNNNNTSLSTSSTKEEKDSGEFAQSDHIRGYKIVGGKKTSFFHHEQTEEEKRLIGDIAPKRLDPSNNNSINNNNNNNTANGNGNTSAWNTAGTWEEKDVTTAAKELLTSQLLLANYALPDSSPSPRSVARVTKVKKVNGHASVATARGKRRYIYEFDVEVEWVLTLPDDDTEVRGTLAFPDIDGTCERGEYEAGSYRVEDAEGAPAGARHLLDRFVRNGGLRDEIVTRVDEWVDLLKATYA